MRERSKTVALGNHHADRGIVQESGQDAYSLVLHLGFGASSEIAVLQVVCDQVDYRRCHVANGIQGCCVRLVGVVVCVGDQGDSVQAGVVGKTADPIAMCRVAFQYPSP